MAEQVIRPTGVLDPVVGAAHHWSSNVCSKKSVTVRPRTRGSCYYVDQAHGGRSH